MLSFDERMALLDAALARHTPESLFEELSQFPASGPSLAAYSVEMLEKVTVIEPCNVESADSEDTTFAFNDVEFGEAA